ncbi:hypothetical protein [Clostridium botulinum]|uniref:hypothetical protein n=1 Tax=Clostridium botulinum TaxID=1491 RepID=UPI001FD64AC7|nr:hypothetical protein [Clostridium botulinum]MCJ8173200.1 hypothetical protein [Clostridium botulinum]
MLNQSAIWSKFNQLNKHKKLNEEDLKQIVLDISRNTLNSHDVLISKKDIGRHVSWECFYVQIKNEEEKDIIIPFENPEEILIRAGRDKYNSDGQELKSLEWILPPFQSMGKIQEYLTTENKKNIEEMYSLEYLSTMVINKYSKTEYIVEFNDIIKEAVEVFCLGYKKSAIVLLLTAIEGILKSIAGDKLIDTNLNNFHIVFKDVIKFYLENFKDKILFYNCWCPEKYREDKFLRKIDETVDAMLTLEEYFNEFLYVRSERFHGNTNLNRHIILHGLCIDYDDSLNFYKLISCIDCIVFLICITGVGSLFPPKYTEESIIYFYKLKQLSNKF